jgi:hypothetical protein
MSEGGKWNGHQMACVYSSRLIKNYRICPIRIEIIHGRHRVVQIYACHELYAIWWPFHLPPSDILNWFWIICIWTRYFKTKIWMLTWKTYLLCIFQHRFDWTIPDYIKTQPMCKFAQLYACHELFLNWVIVV